MWKIVKFLLGPLGDIFTGITNYKTQKAILDAGLLKEVIMSDIEINRMKLQMAAINKEWWVTRWIMPAFAYPMAIHLGAVVADSIFFFDWDVAALPGPIAEWEGQIVLSFFIVGTAERVVTKWVNRGLINSVVEGARSIFRREK